MPTDELQLTLEIICTDLPGLEYEGHLPLHLGIQEDDDIIETAPADRERIVFRPTLRVRKNADGSANFLGPFAHGPRQERFVYLNWVVIKDKKQAERIGRIKLHLNHIAYADAEKAATRDKTMKVRLQLTSEKAKPVFASIRRDRARWEL